MYAWRTQFGLVGDRVWLNTAHQGIIPIVAQEAAHEAVAWKAAPWRLTSERFYGVPARLRAVLARLIGAHEDDIILANSASYSLHLLANGVPWASGDEVLVMEGDFPSDILPWLGLSDRGVTVRRLKPRATVLAADEIEAAIGPHTRLLCLTWVHSLSGFAIDLNAIGEVCRAHGVIFVVNASQALVNRAIDITTAPVDALISVGFKWLCGPYGTGFAWIRPELRNTLVYNQNYWLATLSADALDRPSLDLTAPDPTNPRRYDVFGTANFFNFHPFAAAVSFLQEQGPERIAQHNQALVDRFIAGLDRDRYRLLSPAGGPARSTLVYLSHADPARNTALLQTLAKARIHLAARTGSLRLSPHLYNTVDDIDQLLTALAAFP